MPFRPGSPQGWFHLSGLKIWDLKTGQWGIVENAVFDSNNNYVNFDLDIIPGLIIISEEMTTEISKDEINKPKAFILMQKLDIILLK